jgi:hypothetical protein
LSANQPTPPTPAEPARARDERPVYEPPRITKKRSVSRATLVTGTGPTQGGLIGDPS